MEWLELKQIMDSWPLLMSQTTDPWALKFTADIWELAVSPKWRPTLKQAQVMRQLHREIEN